MANDLEKWEMPTYIGGTVLAVVAMVFGIPLVFHLLTAWDKWLTKVFG